MGPLMFDQKAIVIEMEKLRRFALRLTRNGSDAEDLLQATVLRALEKNEMFETGTDLFKWSSKIMFNLFVTDYRRKTKFETQYDPESYLEKESVDSDQENNVELSRVRSAMKMLSDDHRDILTMVCIKGMLYQEVSEVLQIPVGTVRSRLSRAREQLQILLDSPAIAQEQYHARIKSRSSNKRYY
jgi:RNA polymerase sigma-70 factor (ECF subfamily)